MVTLSKSVLMGRGEIREALTGPIASVRIPFERDGSIDLHGLNDLIEFLIGAGSKSLLLTYGDSLFTLLTDEEVAEVTRFVAERAASRAMVVAADRSWATPKSVAFARYCREAGVSVLMVLPPDWERSCTVDTLVEHYSSIAEQIPVMVVTNYFVPRGINFGLKVVKALVDGVDGIVAVKDDFCGEFGRKMALLTYGRWAVFAGGQKQNHLDLHQYGCDGYLSTFITLKPDVAHLYWRAIQADDLEAARDVIKKFDIPFFDYVMGLRGGFDAGMHGAMELFGVAKRWRRKPYYSLGDEEMEKLSDFLRRLSLL